jgi:hypothetical protein
MPEEPVERPIQDYITKGAAEGAMAAAQLISDAAGLALNEVLTAVRNSHEAAATLTGTATLTAGAGVVVLKTSDDEGKGTEGISVVRQAEVEQLSSEASRGRLPAVLQNTKLRLLVAVVLLTAVYPVLPPEVQSALKNEAELMSAIMAILALLKS